MVGCIGVGLHWWWFAIMICLRLCWFAFMICLQHMFRNISKYTLDYVFWFSKNPSFFNDFMKVLIFHWFYHCRCEGPAGVELRLPPPPAALKTLQIEAFERIRLMCCCLVHSWVVCVIGLHWCGLPWCWFALMIGLHWWLFAMMLLCIDVGLHGCWVALMLVCIDAGLHWWLVCINVGLHWWWVVLVLVCIDDGLQWWFVCVYVGLH